MPISVNMKGKWTFDIMHISINMKGKWTFDIMHISVDIYSKKILKDVSFVVPAGQTFALVIL
jgi:ABC-type transport system involved in Fe-S cluster assembly fused permease/ATPase subunit